MDDPQNWQQGGNNWQRRSSGANRSRQRNNRPKQARTEGVQAAAAPVVPQQPKERPDAKHHLKVTLKWVCFVQELFFIIFSLFFVFITVYVWRECLEALGRSKECRAGEGSGPRQVHEDVRDRHPQVASGRAQLHPLYVRKGGEEAQRGQLRTRQHFISHTRNTGVPIRKWPDRQHFHRSGDKSRDNFGADRILTLHFLFFSSV